MRVNHLVIVLGVALLLGCADRTVNQSADQSLFAQPASPAPQPPIPISPSQLSKEQFSCVTPNYFAEISWEQDQPRMSFGRANSAADLRNASVAIVGNADGSKTYGSSAEATFYTRVFSDQSCLLQSLDSQQNIIVEEYGRVGAVRQNMNNSAANTTQELNQDNLAMTCFGTIQNSVDFTAYRSGEAGFHRVDLKPQTANATLTASLSYDGKNAQGQGIWRGNVNQMADITLVHLSASPSQKGDEVSVGYDGRWGQATCQ